jgi:hypothetical protein
MSFPIFQRACETRLTDVSSVMTEPSEIVFAVNLLYAGLPNAFSPLSFPLGELQFALYIHLWEALKGEP